MRISLERIKRLVGEIAKKQKFDHAIRIGLEIDNFGGDISHRWVIWIAAENRHQSFKTWNELTQFISSKRNPQEKTFYIETKHDD